MVSVSVPAHQRQADPTSPQISLSELAVERRIFCLDRMENGYFKKGAHVAVQRFESAGITLPPPAHGLDEDLTAVPELGKVLSGLPMLPPYELLTEVSDESSRVTYLRGTADNSGGRDPRRQRRQHGAWHVIQRSIRQ